MPNLRLKAAFMRGGTSKARDVPQQDLPADRNELGRDLPAGDGLARSQRPPARRHGRRASSLIEGLRRRAAEPAGRRRRLHLRADRRRRAARRLQRQLRQHVLGDRAVRDRGRAGPPRRANGEAVVRIHNTNTCKDHRRALPRRGRRAGRRRRLRARRRRRHRRADPARISRSRRRQDGQAAADGTGARSPRACRGSAPSRRRASMPPTRASSSPPPRSARRGTELPDALEQDAPSSARWRRSAAPPRCDGPCPDLDAAARIASIPESRHVSAPRPARATLSGRELAAGDADICIRMISVGQPHRAVPITGAICLAVAARVPGSIPHQLCRRRDRPAPHRPPSGTTLVDASVVAGAADGRRRPSTAPSIAAPGGCSKATSFTGRL